MKKTVILFIIIGLALIGAFYLRTYKKTVVQSNSTSQNQPQSDEPKIISTKPDPLDNTTIPASQVIEITFNRSLQNAPEFKVRIEPKVDFKVELSSDRKTAKIITSKPFNLGAEYTLSIAPDTKFDGIGEWKQDKSFHFRTIKYTGV